MHIEGFLAKELRVSLHINRLSEVTWGRAQCVCPPGEVKLGCI